MDEFLPSEILAKIASNLSYKDVNSLLRTSKTAHAKLTPYRHIWPKMECRARVECRRDKICLQVFFDLKDRERIMTANFYDRIESGVDELTEEENRDRVVQSYKGSQNARVEERTFRNRLEGLSLHIQIIQSFALIESFFLNKFDDEFFLEKLTGLMRQNRSRIQAIYIKSTNFHSSHLEFITACKPRILMVIGEVLLPDNFYNLPAIQRLTTLILIDLSDEKTVHNLSLLSATDISIEGRNNFTIDDVKQIIIQWAESKRKIKQIFFDFNNSLNQQKCMEWIGHLDNDLFKVKQHTHEESEENEWILTRCGDCAKLAFHIAGTRLVIYSHINNCCK